MTSARTSATAVVHLDYDTLTGGLKAAHLDTGEPRTDNILKVAGVVVGVIVLLVVIRKVAR